MPKNTKTTSENIIEEHHSYFGVILSILIMVLMGILAGLYLWSENIIKNKTTTTNITPIARPTAQNNNEPESTNAEAQVETLGAMSTSDEIDAIEADADSTPFNSEVFDAELEVIEAELAQ
jgi:hypothetical protein